MTPDQIDALAEQIAKKVLSSLTKVSQINSKMQEEIELSPQQRLQLSKERVKQLRGKSIQLAKSTKIA